MNKQEYLEAVKQTMQDWIAAHFTYEGWLKKWFQTDDYDLTEYCSEVLQWRIDADGDYRTLHYDIRELAWKETAKRIQPNMRRCPVCNQMDEFGSYCDCDAEELDTPEVEEIEEWLRDCEIDSLITDYDIEVGLVVVFDDYLWQVRPWTEPIREDIEANLEELINNPTDEAIAWANHLMHVSGNIVEDYGPRFGLEEEVIQTVSEMGLAYFGEEQ